MNDPLRKLIPLTGEDSIAWPPDQAFESWEEVLATGRATAESLGFVVIDTPDDPSIPPSVPNA